MALTTYQRLKSLLAIKPDDTNHDAVMAEIIERVSAEIVGRCRRTFEFASGITEYFDGDGVSSVVVLSRSPNVAVTSLYDDTNRTYASSSLIQPADYVVDGNTGVITLNGFFFARSLQNIKVIYDGGYKTIPQDLERAALIYAASDFLDHQGELRVSLDVEVINKIDRQRKEAGVTIDRYVRFIL